MRNRGAALYRDVMYERVWGGIPDTESLRTVDTHIARLRKKLGWTDKIETAFVLSGATWLHENLTETKIVKAEKKTGACSQFSEAYPIFYKNNKKWGIAMLFLPKNRDSG